MFNLSILTIYEDHGLMSGGVVYKYRRSLSITGYDFFVESISGSFLYQRSNFITRSVSRTGKD